MRESMGPHGTSRIKHHPTEEEVSTLGLLDGRVAIVTGVDGVLGAGVAEAYAKEGAKLMLVGQDEAKVKETAQKVEGIAPAVQTYICDTGVNEEANQLVEETEKTLGPVEIICDATFSTKKFPLGLPESNEVWDEAYKEGCVSFYNLAMAARDDLIECGHGRIVAFGSVPGAGGEAERIIHAAIGEGIRGMVRNWGLAWGPYGVITNAIIPQADTIDYQQWVEAVGQERADKFFERGHHVQRNGDPATDIGGVAVFLASDLAQYVSGRTIVTDGGRSSEH